MMLALLFALSLQAQVGSILPHSVYPGSRVSIQDGSPLPSPPFATITAAGREYQLPWISSKFPPPDELDPATHPGNVYLVPRDLPWGPATIRYRDQVQSTEIGGYAPRTVYTIRGTSIAYAQQRTGSGAIRRNRLTDPARPGDRITLWGTGFDGDSLAYVGDLVPAVVEHQPDGLDRIEFTLPEPGAGDCFQRVLVGSRPVTISTAAHGVANCPHPWGIVHGDLQRLDRGLTIPAAAFRFATNQVRVQFGNYSLLDLAATQNLSADLSGIVLPITSVSVSNPGLSRISENCEVRRIQGFTPGEALSFGDSGPEAQSQELEIAPQAELIGPDGTRYVERFVTSSSHLFTLESQGDPMWKPGKWIFYRSSDETVSVEARTPFRWKVQQDLEAYTRDRDLLFEWDPTLGGSDELVSLFHTQIGDTAVDGVIGHDVTCTAPMNSGRLFVPANAMRSIQWVPTGGPPYSAAYYRYRPSVYRAPDGRYVQVSYY